MLGIIMHDDASAMILGGGGDNLRRLVETVDEIEQWFEKYEEVVEDT